MTGLHKGTVELTCQAPQSVGNLKIKEILDLSCSLCVFYSLSVISGIWIHPLQRRDSVTILQLSPVPSGRRDFLFWLVIFFGFVLSTKLHISSFMGFTDCEKTEISTRLRAFGATSALPRRLEQELARSALRARIIILTHVAYTCHFYEPINVAIVFQRTNQHKWI